MRSIQFLVSITHRKGNVMAESEINSISDPSSKIIDVVGTQQDKTMLITSYMFNKHYTGM